MKRIKIVSLVLAILLLMQVTVVNADIQTIQPIDTSALDALLEQLGETPEIEIETIETEIQPIQLGNFLDSNKYIYDFEYPELVKINGIVSTITDKSSALKAIENTISSMTDEQKNYSTNVDLVTLLAEEATAKATKIDMDINVDINEESIGAIANDVVSFSPSVDKIIEDGGIEKIRETKTKVLIESSADKVMNINQSSLGESVDEIKVSSDFVSITVDAKNEGKIEVENTGTNKVTVNFDTNKTSTVKVSFPGIDKNTEYMAVVDETGNAVGGKYNPATGEIEAKITASGEYSVIYNEKDFEDIKSKADEMQEAIKTLAAKGVINGTSATSFSPDDTISRAEVAALIVRTISKLDPNEDGGFIDVTRSNWYFGVAGSSKKHGIINGFEDNTFRGEDVITKDQIVAVTARVLKNEMNYKVPENMAEYLGYSDADSLPEWAKADIALANMANLVMDRTDNKFVSEDNMTRGDAAIILMRLFNKIW